MEWISVEDNLPPQGWEVIVKNGKSILPYVKYRYKKWHHWDKILHRVTHWRFSEDNKPSIPPKDLNAYMRRAEKYRHQMQTRKFKTGPIVGLNSKQIQVSATYLNLINELLNM